jgi:hypothetical protein
MTANRKGSKTTLSARIQELRTGLQEYLATKTLVLNGKPVKCSDVVATLQQQVTLQAQTAAAHKAWQEAVAAERAQYTTDVRALFVQIRMYVAAQYGVGSTEYRAMGFALPKTPQKTAVTKAQAVLQSAATRKARNTMGRKQKLAIRGVVPSASIAPASATTATPASAAASTSAPNGTATPSR